MHQIDFYERIIVIKKIVDLDMLLVIEKTLHSFNQIENLFTKVLDILEIPIGLSIKWFQKMKFSKISREWKKIGLTNLALFWKFGGILVWA